MQDKKSKTRRGLSEVKISFKPPKDAITISDSNTAHQFLTAIWETDLLYLQEQFYAVFLNAANQVICWRNIGTGTSSQVLIDQKLLALMAVMAYADKVIIAHNHPSDIPKPSDSDLVTTYKIQHVLQYFNISVVDHIIMCGSKYYSMKDDDVLENKGMAI